MNLDEIINKYNDLFDNKTRCYCHDLQDIIFSDNEIKLFLDNDEIPEIQRFLGYLYFNTNKEKSESYLNKSINNGILKSYNTLACLQFIKKEENYIETFLKAMENKAKSSFSNLGLTFNKLGDIENSKKYFMIGIEQDINCCKTIYLNLYHENDVNYFDQLMDCAKKGCRTALNYCLKNGKIEEKLYYLELGTKYGFNNYIIDLMKYYKKCDTFKFLKMLEQYKSSNDSKILFYIGKKFFELGRMDNAIDIMYKSMELGSNEAFEYLKSKDLIILNNIDPIRKQLIINIFKKNIKIEIDKLNLSIIYCVDENYDEAKKIIEEIDDPYYLNLGKSKLYENLKHHSLALEYLMNAYKLDPEQKKINILSNIGSHLLLNKNEKEGLEYLEKGISFGDIRCYLTLSDYYVKNQKYLIATNYLIEPYKKKIMGYENILETILENTQDVEIYKLMVENEISECITYLLKLENDKIISIFNKKYIFADGQECEICFENYYKLKINCGHIYCINCLKEIKNCPACKYKIKKFLKNKI